MAQVDFFTSRKTTPTARCGSLNPRDLPPLRVDAMAHTPLTWALLYALLPLKLNHPFLKRIRQERLSLILVATKSRSSLWFPELATPSYVAPWLVLVKPGRPIHHPHDLSGGCWFGHAPSTSSLYTVKWSTNNHIVPSCCEVGGVLCFLKSLLEKGVAFFTVKVFSCRAAVSTHRL